MILCPGTKLDSPPFWPLSVTPSRRAAFHTLTVARQVPGADAFYSERLVRLSGLGAYLYRPQFALDPVPNASFPAAPRSALQQSALQQSPALEAQAPAAARVPEAHALEPPHPSSPEAFGARRQGVRDTLVARLGLPRQFHLFLCPQVRQRLRSGVPPLLVYEALIFFKVDVVLRSIMRRTVHLLCAYLRPLAPCPSQALVKFHPDFDDALVVVLERDPLAYVLVLDRADRALWSRSLVDRLAAKLLAQRKARAEAKSKAASSRSHATGLAEAVGSEKSGAADVEAEAEAAAAAAARAVAQTVAERFVFVGGPAGFVRFSEKGAPRGGRSGAGASDSAAEDLDKGDEDDENGEAGAASGAATGSAPAPLRGTKGQQGRRGPEVVGMAALYEAADVVLDGFPTSGYITSLQALSVGAPVVTLPSQFLGGRLTLAMYRAMGLTSPPPTTTTTTTTTTQPALPPPLFGQPPKGIGGGVAVPPVAVASHLIANDAEDYAAKALRIAFSPKVSVTARRVRVTVIRALTTMSLASRAVLLAGHALAPGSLFLLLIVLLLPLFPPTLLSFARSCASPSSRRPHGSGRTSRPRCSGMPYLRA